MSKFGWFLYAHRKMGYHVMALSVCPKTPFPRYNSKSFTAINFKPDIYPPHRPLKNPIGFGVMTLIFKVTEVTKVKFG